MNNFCGKCSNPRNRRHGIRGRGRPWNKTKFRSLERVLAAIEQGTGGKGVGERTGKRCEVPTNPRQTAS